MTSQFHLESESSLLVTSFYILIYFNNLGVNMIIYTDPNHRASYQMGRPVYTHVTHICLYIKCLFYHKKLLQSTYARNQHKNNQTNAMYKVKHLIRD